MNTLLLAPEMFRSEGGIARILRLYLKALCEQAGPNDEIRCIVLNDGRPDPQLLDRYATPALRSFTGCERRIGQFVAKTTIAIRRSDRIVCGHLHLLTVTWLTNLAGLARPSYLIAHGIEVWRPYSPPERAALNGARRILCVSNYTRRQLLRFCPDLDSTRLLTVPNALDPHLTAPREAIADTGTALPGPRILTVARLQAADAYKGIDTLLEAMPGVLRELPGASLRIVGNGDDESRLRELARALGLHNQVHFAGRIDDAELAREYACCDLFALPSRKEGFGLVFLEAMIHGKPCLAARAGGAPEVINENVGTLVEYGDIAGLTTAIVHLTLTPRRPDTIRRHAESFAYPAFASRLAAALA